MATRQSGTVKWFNQDKGYGFILPEQGEKDIFVHVSAVNKSGLQPADLQEGAAITFELETRNTKTSAVNLSLA